MTDPSSQTSDSNRQNISGSIRISSRQKGNPVLKHIRKVPWEFEEGLVADYILGPSCVALYLSVRYYTLQPDYIHERIKLLGRGHRLRVLLVQVDVKVWFWFYYCEAQGKGRARGGPRKVTQRSFIDGGWWMVDILSLMLYTKFGCHPPYSRLLNRTFKNPPPQF